MDWRRPCLSRTSVVTVGMRYHHYNSRGWFQRVSVEDPKFSVGAQPDIPCREIFIASHMSQEVNNINLTFVSIVQTNTW
jgi:hypothetical protein